MADPQPLPSPTAIAQMEAHELRGWSVRAMGWKSTSRGQHWLFVAPDGTERHEGDWHPEENAKDAIELAEKVFGPIGGYQVQFEAIRHEYRVSPRVEITPEMREWHKAHPPSYFEFTGPQVYGDTLALALSRAAVTAYVARQRHA